MYFSGIDATVRVSRGDKNIELDAVSVEFALVNNSRPVYNPAEKEVGAFMGANVMAQGSLVLNHTDDSRNVLNSGDWMTIIYSTSYPELVNNIYQENAHSKSYDIEHIEVISINHALSPIVDNLTDIYQFIAKRLVSY